ncbi:MAG: nuclear transport factor 2 family protein [Pseudomonadales bacterium]
MKSALKKQLSALLTLLTLLCWWPMASIACTPDSIAVQYLRAIEAGNVDKMATFMGDDIHYYDPTMTYFGTAAIDFNSKAETVKFWSDSFRDAQVDSMTYDIQQCFQAGTSTVMVLHLNTRVAGQVWGVNKAQIELSGTHIMSLEISAGKISKQTDYVDYAEVIRQVEQLKTQHGSVAN